MENKNIKEIKYASYLLNEDNSIMNINDEFISMTGYTNDDLKEIKQDNLISSSDKTNFFKLIQDSDLKKDLCLEYRLKKKDKTDIFVISIFHFINKENIKAEVRLIDISRSTPVIYKFKDLEKKYNKKMKNLVNKATIDSLTGLLRRDAYEYKVNNFLKNKISFAFVMVDIDDFKNINDTYGHDVGDRILKNVCDIFSRCLCNQGIGGRIGGDEFSLIILNVNTKKEVLGYLEDIRREVDRISIREDANFKVTVSMGVKIFKHNCKNVCYNDLYVKADKLLYKSKRNGKNQINF